MGRARLHPCRQVTKNKVPRRYGATTKKPDTLVAVAPDGRVGQHRRLKACPERSRRADALIRTRVKRGGLSRTVWHLFIRVDFGIATTLHLEVSSESISRY